MSSSRVIARLIPSGLLLLAACGSGNTTDFAPPAPEPDAQITTPDAIAPQDAGAPEVSCDDPNEGCPCEPSDEPVDCGTVYRRSGTYIACSPGLRMCIDGGWSACIGDRIAIAPVATP